jgi:AcrR family transcriptional regulator
MATTYPTTTRRARGPRISADERRAEIVEAAVTAFAANGYAGTSTETIADLAGVSQPYVFRLFGSKQELFLAAVDRAFGRVTLALEVAARTPVGEIPGLHPILGSMARAYQRLLTDRSLLRIQLHAYAASGDPVVGAFVRQRYAALVHRVSDLSGVPAAELRGFFAEGMLMTVAASLDLTDADVAWTVMCDGGPA